MTHNHEQRRLCATCCAEYIIKNGRQKYCHPECRRLCTACSEIEYSKGLCRKHYMKQYFESNAIAIREQKAQYNQERASKLLLSGARKRAERRGLAFTIEQSDVIVPSVCPLLGITLTSKGSDVRTAHGRDNCPSLDRMNPALGYIKGNVWVISYRANSIKSNATLAELRAIASGLEKVLC